MHDWDAEVYRTWRRSCKEASARQIHDALSAVLWPRAGRLHSASSGANQIKVTGFGVGCDGWRVAGIINEEAGILIHFGTKKAFPSALANTAAGQACD